MNCHRFLVRYFVHTQVQVETIGGYNTTTHKMTPLLPGMLHSTLQASENYSLQYDPMLTLLSH